MFNNNRQHIGRQASDFRYFDFGRHWNSKLRGIFESDVVQAQLFKDFSKFQKGKERRFNQSNIDRGLPGAATFPYMPTDKPIRCDSTDWRCGRVGRPYSFDEYVCHGACHWVVNSLLLTAIIAYPDKPWVIVSSPNHSTVWDQGLTFFDINYFALKVSPEDCAISTVFDDECHILGEGVLLDLE